MSKITVQLSSRYSNRSTTARATLRPACGGTYEVAELSARQMREAAARCCYAGTDWPLITPLEGWGDWEPMERGGMSAIRRVSK